MPQPVMTDRQSEILDFIRGYIERHGYGPTLREIGKQFKIGSPNGVAGHIRALKRKGLIENHSHKSRTLSLADELREETSGMPVLGRIQAGMLHEAVADRNRRVVLTHLFKKSGMYLLEVEGDSMIEAHIADGDWVVVDPNRPARTGAIAVVQTEDGDATLKYWYPEKKRIRLQPANKKMRPIYVRNAKVLGVVSGVIRQV